MSMIGLLNCHRKVCSPRPTAHETHTTASQKQLEDAGITKNGHSRLQVSAPPSEVVAGGRQCTSWPTITPSKTRCASLYRRIKRRVGRSLQEKFYCVNTSYPMDNCLSGRRRPARQTSEKDVLCFHRPAGP